MLRALLLYLSQAAWARQIVTGWGVAWRVASRFVAGETLDDAVRVVRELNARGFNTTLDHLGEYTTNEEEACKSAKDAIEILGKIEAEGLRSGISIKLTQIGLAIDPALCKRNLESILAQAAEKGIFLRIDMEDSSHTARTIRLYEEMADRFGQGKVGIVIQSYLYRSEQDTAALMAHGARVRLCKGAYKEPPEVAYPEKAEVDSAFDRLTDILVEGSMRQGCPPVSQDGRTPPILAIASHDDRRIEYAVRAAELAGLPKEALEFQMLHGIRRDLQDRLLAQGYPIRIYVPFGSEWYPYFTRRLAERPANLWFFLSNLVKK
jgi:proline dehydrogenase